MKIICGGLKCIINWSVCNHLGPSKKCQKETVCSTDFSLIFITVKQKAIFILSSGNFWWDFTLFCDASLKFKHLLLKTFSGFELKIRIKKQLICWFNTFFFYRFLISFLFSLLFIECKKLCVAVYKWTYLKVYTEGRRIFCTIIQHESIWKVF